MQWLVLTRPLCKKAAVVCPSSLCANWASEAGVLDSRAVVLAAVKELKIGYHDSDTI